jgi:D-glycero-alpha-D-manno-heptose-7-phosphate kinase
MSDMDRACQMACFDGRVEMAIEVPVRVCDVGGWTDTWFAGHGRVCSLAAGPGVSVDARAEPGEGRLTFELADYGVRFAVEDAPTEHELLAAAAREAGAAPRLDITLRVSSAVPPGSSLGTSAAVCVGVVAALDAARGVVRGPAELAAAAHRAEAGGQGRESGVQDQVASAHGGANLIDVPGYPTVERRPIALSPAMADALDQRLVHIAYGTPHDSSEVHGEVIAALQSEGHASSRLEVLRGLADEAAAALAASDVARYGRALTAATDGQAALHPALLSGDAHELIETARQHQAAGWKVNGAGGEGGSISVLCGDPGKADEIRRKASALGHRPLDLGLAPQGARAVAR